MGIRRNAGGLPVGTSHMHAGATPPPGSLVENGAGLSTTTYAALFAVIGYTYGGAGATFNLPDSRGEFWRAADQGRGVDAGRAVGTAQAEAIKTHTVGELNEVIVASGAGAIASNAQGAGTGRTITYTGGAETRPRNVARLACIRYAP